MIAKLKILFQNKFTWLGILTVLVFILSFPKLDPEISPGLDPSYQYALNSIFANDVQQAKDITFTYGPLGFIKHLMPIGNNLEISLFVHFLVRLLFIFLFLSLAVKYNKPLLQSFLLIYIYCCNSGFDLMIFGSVAIISFFYWEKRKVFLLVLNSFILAFMLLVKINIAIIGGLIFFSFLVYDFYQNRQWKPAITAGISFFTSLFILWFVIFFSFSGLLCYLKSTLFFSVGNSSAFSINPDNNWSLLTIVLALLLFVPFYLREKKISLLYIIFSLAFFAVFKYGFARQENYHIKFFIDFLLLFVFLIFTIAEKIKPGLIALIFLVLILFYRNTEINKTYEVDDRIKLFGVNNFSEVFFDYSTFKQKCVERSENNLKSQILPENIIKKIGNATVDCFPWDLSYIPANHLKYQPRPMLQSGCLFAPPAIDNQNASFISSAKAASFMIWEINKTEGKLMGIDNRYLLNSDGKFLFEFFNHYEIVDKTDKIVLFSKTQNKRFSAPAEQSKISLKFNEWIDVPKTDHGVLRAKIQYSKSFLGKIKSFLYKDGEYNISYKLKTGEIIKHRFSSDNSETGLWINPYIKNIADDFRGEMVEQICFSFTDEPYIVNEKIDLVWEFMAFSGKYSQASSYLGKNILFSSSNDFEKPQPYWTGDSLKYEKQIVFAGKRSFKLDSQTEYSPPFTTEIEKLSVSDSAELNISVYGKLAEMADAMIVFDVSRNGKNIEWKSVLFSQFIKSPEQWTQVTFNNLKLNSYLPKDILKIYVWNKSKKAVYIDDFRIEQIIRK